MAKRSSPTPDEQDLSESPPEEAPENLNGAAEEAAESPPEPLPEPVPPPPPPPGGHPNIGHALWAVWQDVDYIQKKRHSGQLQYTFASEADVIAKLRPVLIKHGLIMYPVENELTVHETFTTARGTNMNRIILRMVWRIEHVGSGQTRDIPIYGEGMDTGDKATNKAHTIAGKYAILKGFMLETGDDPDITPSAEQERSNPNQTGNRPTPRQAPNQASQGKPGAQTIGAQGKPQSPAPDLREIFNRAKAALESAATTERVGEIMTKASEYFHPGTANHGALERFAQQRLDALAGQEDDIPF